MTIQFEFPNEGPYFIESFKFNAGEVQVTIPEGTASAVSQNRLGTVTARIHSSDDLMELVMVTDAYKRINPMAMYTLVIPYLPYSRQDRVANPGEALSSKVFADIINSLNYRKVFTFDAHSDVSVACITNCESYDQVHIINRFSERFGSELRSLNSALEDGYFTLMSPDAGANKKTLKIAQHYGGLRIIRCDKVRDTETGEITRTSVDWDGVNSMRGMNLLMVDDICDGGRTFIEIAKTVGIHEPASISLYVTHGIFSKGLMGLVDSGIRDIYTTDSMEQDEDIRYSDHRTILTL